MFHSSISIKKFVLLAAAATGLISFSAGAVDLDWSGLYRVEGTFIKNSELEGGREKAYGLHHLILKPKIVAADGLIIHSRFDIFNIADPNDPIYNNSQMGQVFGHGVGGTVTAPTQPTSANSNSFSRNQKAETLEVTQLYLTWDQEFGSLIVGRAPVQFGLGMTYSAGGGLFDHWYDTRDLVGYKIVMGNLYLLPMYAKVSEGALNRGVDDMNEYLIQAQYDNPETDISMGVMYQVRTSSAGDGPVALAPTDPPLIGGTNATNAAPVNMSWVNIYALKDTERFRVGLEASFQSGKTGVVTASDDKVSLEGFGVAGEFEYRPDQSRWKYGLKAGIATGDDPGTDNKYEGYIFSRNYDVAFLLFNHPFGQDDFSRTYLVGGNPRSGRVETADTNAISNITYASIYADYKWTDRFTVIGSLTSGWFSEKASTAIGSQKKDAGYETDFTLRFSPKAGVVWDNQVGLLFPGSAFKGGGAYEAGFAYGFGTRAAISF